MNLSDAIITFQVTKYLCYIRLLIHSISRLQWLSRILLVCDLLLNTYHRNYICYEQLNLPPIFDIKLLIA